MIACAWTFNYQAFPYFEYQGISTAFGEQNYLPEMSRNFVKVNLRITKL